MELAGSYWQVLLASLAAIKVAYCSSARSGLWCMCVVGKMAICETFVVSIIPTLFSGFFFILALHVPSFFKMIFLKLIEPRNMVYISVVVCMLLW